jgi:hypothetical protein
MSRLGKCAGHAAAAAAVALVVSIAITAFDIPHLWAGAARALPALAILSLVGAAVICWAALRPRQADIYRKHHERLAGPRPGAHLPP